MGSNNRMLVGPGCGCTPERTALGRLRQKDRHHGLQHEPMMTAPQLYYSNTVLYFIKGNILFS